MYIDSRTCNGVVPHPYYPIFASYGIDSDVKRRKLSRALPQIGRFLSRLTVILGKEK